MPPARQGRQDPSDPNPRRPLRRHLVPCPVGPFTAAGDASQDSVCGPAERLGVAVAVVEERVDRPLQVRHAAEDAAADAPVAGLGEAPLAPAASPGRRHRRRRGSCRSGRRGGPSLPPGGRRAPAAQAWASTAVESGCRLTGSGPPKTSAKADRTPAEAGPPPEAVPLAGPLGQVTPRDACPGRERHGIDEREVVGGGAAGVARLAVRHRRDRLPLGLGLGLGRFVSSGHRRTSGAPPV